MLFYVVEKLSGSKSGEANSATDTKTT